ncbi:rhodanese-like domain-containing protein [Kitasatospora sp. NPDC048365]|uniref:rhodanese-like domain-containing protein n=1 Tax=Kitasatospora sp. NPDC048365 TaxID=3364050 RepID=UPI00372370AC
MSAQSPAVRFDPERQQLEEQVAAAELAWLTLDVDVATLRVEIDNFALLHHQLLGPLYARLDELDALVAEARAALSGDPEDLRLAAEARARVEPPIEPELREAEPDARRVRPDRDAQRVYRELARRAHPDLTTDEDERERRSAFIARANEAYAVGDTAALEQLAQEWSTSPDSAPAEDAAERPDWLRRRLEWLTGRIGALATEQVRLEMTPMGELLLLDRQRPELLLEELAERLLATAADRQAVLVGLLPDGPAPASHNGGTDPKDQESHQVFAQLPTIAAASVPADAPLLDVREQDEWDAGHVDGALHIPIGELIARIEELPEQKLYVMCRVGGRSAQVVQYLVAQGREAVNIDGGMYAWEAAGRPMVSASGGTAFVL